jgi:hypothetical protein
LIYVCGSGYGGRWSGMCDGCSLRSPVCNILMLGCGALCDAEKEKWNLNLSNWLKIQLLWTLKFVDLSKMYDNFFYHGFYDVRW